MSISGIFLACETKERLLLETAITKFALNLISSKEGEDEKTQKRVVCKILKYYFPWSFDQISRIGFRLN